MKKKQDERYLYTSKISGKTELTGNLSIAINESKGKSLRALNRKSRKAIEKFLRGA